MMKHYFLAMIMLTAAKPVLSSQKSEIQELIQTSCDAQLHSLTLEEHKKLRKLERKLQVKQESIEEQKKLLERTNEIAKKLKEVVQERLSGIKGHFEAKVEELNQKLDREENKTVYEKSLSSLERDFKLRVREVVAGHLNENLSGSINVDSEADGFLVTIKTGPLANQTLIFKAIIDPGKLEIQVKDVISYYKVKARSKRERRTRDARMQAISRNINALRLNIWRTKNKSKLSSSTRRERIQRYERNISQLRNINDELAEGYIRKQRDVIPHFIRLQQESRDLQSQIAALNTAIAHIKQTSLDQACLYQKDQQVEDKVVSDNARKNEVATVVSADKKIEDAIQR